MLFYHASKVIFQSELDDARPRIGGRDLAKCLGNEGIAVRLLEIYEVEDVKKLGSKFDFGALSNREEFYDAEIDILLAGPAQEVTGSVSKWRGVGRMPSVGSPQLNAAALK